VRHAGLFAPRWKTRYLASARVALAQESNRATMPAIKPEKTKTSLLAWCQRQTDEKGKDPLLCSFCQVEMELIEVVFGSHATIAKYFDMAQRATAPFHPALQVSPG
jgi:hypothetical protein